MCGYTCLWIMEDRGRCQTSFSITLCLIPLRQSLSLNMALGWQFLTSAILLPPALTALRVTGQCLHMPCFLWRHWDQDPDLLNRIGLASLRYPVSFTEVYVFMVFFWTGTEIRCGWWRDHISQKLYRTYIIYILMELACI